MKGFSQEIAEIADQYHVNLFSDLGPIARYGQFEARIEQYSDAAWNDLRECCVTVYDGREFVLSRAIGGCWMTNDYVIRLRIEQYLERKGETA